MKRKYKGLLASASLFAIALGSAAQAQVDVITVTAERRAASLQDVPVAVSAFDGELLRDAGVNSVQDLQLIAPSVTFSQSTNALNSSQNIRGVGTSVFSNAVEPSVSFVVDGVVLARQGQAYADLIDIERIEVLRGPQSTLFGKNASAGVVSIITRGPTDTLSGVADLRLAEGGERALRATLSGPIAQDFGFRITGNYREVDGHLRNVFDGQRVNGGDSWGVRGRLDWTPGDARFTLIADYSEQEDQCCAFTQVRSTSPFLQAVNGPVLDEGLENRDLNIRAIPLSTVEAAGVSLEAEWMLGDHTVTSISAWRAWDFFASGDVDSTPDTTGTPSQLLGPNPNWPQVGSLNINDGRTDLTQFSQELRIASPSGGTFEYILGAYAFFLDLDRRFERAICFIDLHPCPQTFSPAPGVTLPGQLSSFFDASIENRNLALFGQGTWNLSDRLSLIVGARIIHEQIDYTSVRTNATLRQGDLPLGPFFDVAGRISDTGFAARLGVTYALSDEINLYATYNRGYKGPTLDVDFNTREGKVDPETSDAFELGFKSLLFDNTLQLNIALFHAIYSDYQAQGFNSGTPGVPGSAAFILDNVGEISTTGAEVEYVWAPTDRFTLRGGVTYTDAEVRSFPNAQCFQPVSQDPDCTLPEGVKNIAGGRLSNAPRWRAVTTARYEHPLAMISGYAFAQASARYQSEVQYSISQNPNTIQDAFTVVDASIGFGPDHGRYLVSVFVNNLFDQNYTDLLLQHPTETATLNIFQFAPRRAERYFGASIRVQF